MLAVALASIAVAIPTAIFGEGPVRTSQSKFEEAHSTLEILETKEVETLQGRTRVHIIQPPTRLKQMAVEPETVIEPIPDWVSRSVLGGGSKEIDHLLVSVTVYDREASKIELRLGEEVITAHAAIDGNLLSHTTHLETENTVYLVAAFIHNIDLASIRESLQVAQDVGNLPVEFQEPVWISTLERSEDSYISEFTTPDTTGVFGQLMEQLLYSYADEVVRLEEISTQLESQRMSSPEELPSAEPKSSEPEIFMWPKSNSGYQQYSKRREK